MIYAAKRLYQTINEHCNPQIKALHLDVVMLGLHLLWEIFGLISNLMAKLM